MSKLTETHITIIGGGRIGRTFADAAPNHTLIKRGDSLSNVPSGPIVICTRNDDLGPIVDALSPQRHSDLIFVQNGMIENFLASKNISHTTQVLLYIAVSTVGAKAVDGEKTVATGKWADFFCDLMSAAGLKCQTVDRQAYRIQMAEKFLWIAVFGVLCDVHQKVVGEVVMHHRADVDALTSELKGVVARHAGIQIPLGLSSRLCLYSQSIPDYRASVKEWDWRNGWLWEHEKTPLHQSYLKTIGQI